MESGTLADPSCVEKKSLFYILTEKIAEIMPCYQIKK